MQFLPTNLAASHQEILQQQNRIQALERELLYVTEQLRLTRANLFGPSSERRVPEISPAQVLLFSPAETPLKEKKPEKEKITYERTKRQKVEGKLPEGSRFPAHLPREDQIVEEGEGEVEFEKITERLAARESAFFVKRIIRKIRRTAAGSLQSPPVPAAVLERTGVDVSFLAFVLVAKYVWHLPLYRQEQMLKVQGIEISRDTLIRYVIALSDLCKPIYRVLQAELFKEQHLFGDETPVLVGQTRDGKKRFLKSWFWAFLGRHGALFVYAPSRAFKEIEPLLKDYKGSLQSDGYRVYETLSEKYPEITLVGCWAHYPE